MVKLDDKYIFTFDKLTKSWRKERPLLFVQLSTYPQNTKLCVAQALHYTVICFDYCYYS